MSKRIFITVAEVSGDQHAAQLVRSLHKLDPKFVIEGIGGPLMRQAGCTIHHETVKHAAMGAHGLLRYFEIKRILKWTREHFLKHKPDLQIGVDSPDMNIHFAKLAKSIGTPVMQYVAPQTWAWREYRIGKFKRFTDAIGCILPFEETYFRNHGVNATFVGHPLFDELPTDRATVSGLRFPERPPVVGLLPGSRASEARGNYAPMLQVAQVILKSFPGARFVTATTAATEEPVRAAAKEVSAPGLNITIERDAFDRLVPQCDLCIVASGTATLHVAGFGVPMVVVYRGSPILWNLAARWLVKVKTFSLVNLLAGPDQQIVPEYIPWYGQVQPVADLALDLLLHPNRLRSQVDALRQLVAKLDRPGASDNAAKLAISLLR